MSESPVGAVIVLAAGGGTRMRSAKSKLLHEVAGRSLLSYALTAAVGLEPAQLMVVVGHQREQVLAHLDDIAPHIQTAVQEEQNGTGHAVQCGMAALSKMPGEIVVTYGDVPLLTSETLAELVADHRAKQAKVTVATAHVADPTGYGRVIRDGDQVVRIVEEGDATPEERSIHEINSGIYIFDPDILRGGLAQLNTDNAQGELYLTDVIAFAQTAGYRVGAHTVADVWQTEGVNDRLQLSAINSEMNRRILQKWMRAGVTVVDPGNTWIHDTVDLAQDVTLLPGTMLEGATSVAQGATIGPDTTLCDVEVGEGAVVTRTHGSFAVIGAGASVGPFAYLRPGTEIGAASKVGTFVEVKNSIIGPGAKVPHLSYVGDAVIDEDANIGAGTIFANYDGVNKSGTHVGKGSFVGSNSVLVAPVDVAAGTYVAAGSAITGDVAPGQLGIARGRQRNIDDWVATRRQGTKTQAAAEAATGEVHPRVAKSREQISGERRGD